MGVILKFYILDDDEKIIRILENIIYNSNLGEVVGHETDSKKAINDIAYLKPDILLVDLLMPEVDGIALVEAVKKRALSLKVIMISEVSNKSMISKAYEKGIEFFIQKPINRNEVSKVIERVIEKIDLEKKFEIMGSIFNQSNYGKVQTPSDPTRDIKLIFSRLGIMGEKGVDDILCVCNYMLQENISSFDFKIKDICNQLCDQPKAMEQRLRRAINKGLINLANIGIEDNMNEVFTTYANALYDFENVKAEMDYIRGKRATGGKISLRRFIENILLLK